MIRFEFKPKQTLIFVLSVLLVAYFLYQGRFLILGPRVWINNPIDGAVLESPVVEVSGQSSNAAWISLNDRQIFTDEQGYWKETLIVSKGVSIMTVHVRDRFGREKTKQVRVILN